MTEPTETTTQQVGNGSDARKTALRAAAIAAASGATAIAAKKAFSDRQESGSSKQQNGGTGGSGGESMLGGMVGSGWHAAKDSLVPFAEEAANAAGEYLGRSGPDFVRETIVPAFIEGFQGAQKQSAGGE
jgi:hypothetical protein